MAEHFVHTQKSELETTQKYSTRNQIDFFQILARSKNFVCKNLNQKNWYE